MLKLFNDLRCVGHYGGFGSHQRLTRQFLDVENVPAEQADVALFWNDAQTTPAMIRAFPKRKVLYLSANFNPCMCEPGSYFQRYNDLSVPLAEAADAFVHVSRAHRDFFLRYIAPAVASKPHHIFYPMYDPAIYHPAPARPRALRVVATSLWREWHRWVTPFQAFAVVLRQVPSARLIVAGGYAGKDENKKYPNKALDGQQSMAEELRILNAIDWVNLSEIHDVAAQEHAMAEAYRAGNVFVHARFSDWGTLTCVEALASGLPIVCGDNGGLPEIADDCAFIYQYGGSLDSPTLPMPDPNEVAERILQAYAAGEEVRQRSIERSKLFAAPEVCADLEAFLSEIARG